MKKFLVYFDTNLVKIYKLQDNKITLLESVVVYFNETLVNNEMLDKFEDIFKILYKYMDKIDYNVKLYATGIFQQITREQQMQLIIHIFVKYGLYFNIINKELEDFYRSNYDNLKEELITGIINNEFRKVVICGSFQQNIKEIADLIEKLKKRNVEILSPWTLEIIPESKGTDFILLKGQKLINKRDTWRHKYDHMNKFVKADAIIVCNPDGYIGKGTMFEFGFMIAHYKRIIFTEEPKGLTILFPFEVGLNF